jgi:hypothetical protein
MGKLRLPLALLILLPSLVFGQTTRPFGTPGIELKPFMFNPRLLGGSLIDLSFLHDAPAGRTGFIRAHGADLVRGDGLPIRFWGFDLTEWSPGSMEIPPKTDAPIYAEALSRMGVNLVRLHFLDLPAPRGMIDGTRTDSQHFNAAQLDNEDFFIAELLKRGIYIDMNLNVGRQFARGDGVLAARVGKGPLLFDMRLIELEKDYARQLLTHVNPYTSRAYIAEPGMALVEIVNEDAIYPGWTSNLGYNQELTDLYNAWLKTHLSPDELAALRSAVGAGADQPIPRLTGRQVRLAPAVQYDAECAFITDTEGGFFKEMKAYLRHDLGVQCPILATSDHSHSGSSYPLLMDTSQLDVMDGHDYWQHPSENPRNTPMVNEPLNSTVIDLSRTAMVDKPSTVSEMNHPFPNQFACEGIPILAAYAGFQSWDAVVWYTFEQKRDPKWHSYIGDPFDMSLDPIKMPQIAAGALMFERGDLDPARQTVARSYTVQQAYDSRRLPGNNRPYFTPGFPLSVPLLHGSRISSLNGPPTSPISAPLTGPYRSDTGQLAWFGGPNGLVTIDSPRTQGLVGFVRAGKQSTANLAADVRNNFCAIVVNSLTDRPIATSDRLLMTAAARVENTGMRWNASFTRTVRGGTSPTLIEPVIGTITLHDLAPAKQVTVTPLDGTGHALGGPILAEPSSAEWRITVGEPATTWYLIAVER